MTGIDSSPVVLNSSFGRPVANLTHANNVLSDGVIFVLVPYSNAALSAALARHLFDQKPLIPAAASCWSVALTV